MKRELLNILFFFRKFLIGVFNWIFSLRHSQKLFTIFLFQNNHQPVTDFLNSQIFKKSVAAWWLFWKRKIVNIFCECLKERIGTFRGKENIFIEKNVVWSLSLFYKLFSFMKFTFKINLKTKLKSRLKPSLRPLLI